jgi:hypothetical protein
VTSGVGQKTILSTDVSPAHLANRGRHGAAPWTPARSEVV